MIKRNTHPSIAGKATATSMRTDSMAVANPVVYRPEVMNGIPVRAVLVVALLLATFWIALPAYASCSQSATIAFEVTGKSIRGTSNATCTPEFVTYNRIRTQEKVGPVWATRVWSQWSGNSHGISIWAIADCEGHGTDLWRAQGYYESSTGGSGTAYSPPGSQGAWFNCP